MNKSKKYILPEGADGNKCFGYNAFRPFEKKEIKMNEDELTEGTTEVVDHGLAKKEFRPTHVNVNIWEIDAHYLASFNHNPRRVFHSIEELLVAIEVEIKRLGGTLGGG